jgi:hypothetical protein
MPSPPHLIEAERLADYLHLPECPAENNTYKDSDQPSVVTWGNPGEPASWLARAQCASFITAVLMHTYPGWATVEYFRTHFGRASPPSRDYRRVLATHGIPHLRPVTRVADLSPGDILAIDYANGQATNTGHVVMVRRVKGTYTAPSPTLNFPGEVQYAVEIVDCTSDPHGVHGVGDYFTYPDNRIADGASDNDGVGYGHMMCYASESTGAFTRYRWSVNTSSAGTHTVAQRPIAAARVV